ncbi:aminotransferase class I/II-fold pyridoxal phosphate-dependent enzyme [Thiorhodococcus mannitoliphagus]|uniref:Aminotransferase n=1 Tax=Thiorhodococcus mannitoliphagus TaxID=329406 RepID=A0A6P1E035_9GAMM|nr:aminotransferase class I/II-fold pyridoxal phosphate-dependent enzyme [Thiorhodococcus mannitoliphagus]NEX21782.1 aminotransferase class I/II-fold pyridoxal phosphate-dependent enzyme [Thiorhodococcus mannitoliphagus]
MRLLGRARELEAQGRSIVHLEIGEPDFPTPEPIVAAGHAALNSGQTHYTAAAGLPALRQAIADYYGQRYGLDLSPARVLVTPGASGALQLVFSTLLEPGDAVLLGDPSYPCYRQVLGLMGCQCVSAPLTAETDYRLTLEQARAAWVPGIKAVVVASPANPTGALMGLEELAALHDFCRSMGASLIVDEIYQGLTYDSVDATALALQAQDLYVINSFSKYFGMTGWRLGWLVGPEDAVQVMERLAQNLFIAANTPAQHAALAAFEIDTRGILEQRRQRFQQRRDRLYPALRGLGFEIPHSPSGAFYLYAGLPAGLGMDSMTFATGLLEEAGVAVTPGADFGDFRAAEHVRFAYTRDLADLDEAVCRMSGYLGAGG